MTIGALPIYLLLELEGRALSSVMSDATGVSDRTWRKRLNSGWQPSDSEIEQHKIQVRAVLTERLCNKGIPDAKIADYYSNLPSSLEGVASPWADFIYSLTHVGKYEETISLAKAVDRFSASIYVAFQSRQQDKAQEACIQALEWLRSICPNQDSSVELKLMMSRFQVADSLAGIQKARVELEDQILFALLSCWDLEFCSTYLSPFQAYPLFELVMPRLSETIQVENGTGKLLRNGKAPKDRFFDKSILRLIDFMAVLAHKKQYQIMPSDMPSLADMSRWFDVDAETLKSWRDESTRFTYANFEMIWGKAFPPASDGIRIASPVPMLTVSHLWKNLLARKNGKPISITVCFDAYESWWRLNRERLQAKGLRFGDIPWPTCLTAQSLGNISPDSWRSSQSSGRSSNPLHSQ